MKRKEEKGITLIALIITVIVLLILAAVTIRTIVGEGIIDYAENSSEKYQEAQNEENTILQSYEQFINDNLPSDGASRNKEYKVGDMVTINGEKFYVIEDSPESEENVTLLAKYNLNSQGNAQNIEGDEESYVVFATEMYWDLGCWDVNSTDVPENVEFSAIRVAREYAGKIHGSGRLLTYDDMYKLGAEWRDEVIYLLCTDACPEWFHEGNGHGFWLSQVGGGNVVEHHVPGSMYVYTTGFDADDLAGIRPVVTISKEYLK